MQAGRSNGFRFAAPLAAAAVLLCCSACQDIQLIVQNQDASSLRAYACDFGSVANANACQSLATSGGCADFFYSSFSSACRGSACLKAVANVPDRWGILPHPTLPVCNVPKLSTGMTVEPPAKLASAAPSRASALAATLAAVGTKAAKPIAEFAVPRANSKPGPMIVTGDKVVFGELAPCGTPCAKNVAFATIDASGTIEEIETLSENLDRVRTGIAPRPGGGVCFAETHRFFNGQRDPDKVICTSTITGTGGNIKEFSTAVLEGAITGVAFGSDGKLWYVDGALDGVTRLDIVTAQTQSTFFATGTFMGLGSIVSGPDGNLWFTAVSSNQVGSIGPQGLGLRTLLTPDAQPAGIATGPDGALWFTEYKAGKIGRITVAGDVTEFALPAADAQPLGIATGPDGALWFTEFNANRIGRMTVLGELTEYAVPSAGAQPAGIVAGPDGNIWFSEYAGNRIGRITLASDTPQVVEFYNNLLDNYFITASAAEQAAVGGGAAGPGWSLTGQAFSAGGATQVCRFYGSITPGPNSHFYTIDPAECQSLRALQASTPASQKRWNYEGVDFLSTPPANGQCANGTIPVFRAYNNGFARSVDSNHRITTSAAAIQQVVARGWISEGVVMCAPSG